MKGKAGVIGISDVWQGDLGIGSYVIEALEQEELGREIWLVDLGLRVEEVDVYLYQTECAVVVQGLTLGAPPGTIFCWDWPKLKQNMKWLYHHSSTLNPVLFSMFSLAEAFNFFPSDFLFIGVEPAATLGLTPSATVIKTLRKIVCLIKKYLAQRGFLPAEQPQVLPLYRFSLLNVVA